MVRKRLFSQTVVIVVLKIEKNSKRVEADWHIDEMPSKVKALKLHPRIYKVLLKTEYLKASISAKVEHPFRIIKCQFGSW